MTALDNKSLGVLLKSRGLRMSRAKYQRPSVKLWTGKSGQKFWRAEWRVPVEGSPKPKHRVETWPRDQYTKGKAQNLCDRMVRDETSGTLRPDGSITVQEFWEKVFFPIRKRQLADNSRIAYESTWRHHIKPVLGGLQLREASKHSIDTVLAKMADSGKSKQTTEIALSLIKQVFEEAVDNDYLVKNPARKVSLPRCAAAKLTRPLDAAEIQRLFGNTEGRDKVMWRILVLTGTRIGEVLALKKSDLLPAGLQIDESAFDGHASQTKNRKVRIVPIPLPLRQEIEQWAAGVPGDLLFPTKGGKMLRRNGATVQAMVKRVRKAAGIPDLCARMCRTAFATLFQGDPRDLQDILGHSTLDLTMQVYRKPIAERQQASVEELEARLSRKVVEIRKKNSA